jgi:preprotein translocase subunit SecE
MSPIAFLREVKVELEKVVWPGRKQVIELSVLVIVISLIIGIYVGGLDLMFTSIMNAILKQ